MMLVPYFFNKSRLALQIFVVFSLIFYEMVSTNVIPSVQLPKNITSIMPRIARSAYNSLHPIVYLLRTNISDVNAQINTRQSEHGYFLAPSKPAEAFIGPAYDGITECKAVCITVLIVLASIFCKSPVLASILMNNRISVVLLLLYNRTWIHLARHYNHP